MTNVFIIHGAYGNPDENWIPWLKSELEKLNCSVFVPKFPTPADQTLKNWEKVFEKYTENINKDTIFVGHSLGPAFILSLLEKLNTPIKASFFVSGFLEALGNPDFDEINKTFVNRTFDWPTIKQNCKNFFVYHSDNDPYVPISSAENLAKSLEIAPIIIKGAGHFNEASGYKKFEVLLNEIKKVI
jgi:uncharacterized protein